MALFGKLFGRRERSKKLAQQNVSVDDTAAFDASQLSADQTAASGEGSYADEVPEEQLSGEPVEVDLPDGEKLGAQLYRSPDALRDAPAILWLHGDDPTQGPSSRDRLAQMFCLHRPCVVLVVDHPASVVSCHAALAWLRDSAHRNGVATDQLFVGGTGPAADLALELALFERDEGGIAIAYLMALYPSLGSGWDAGFSSVTRSRGLSGLPAVTVIVGMGDPSCSNVTKVVEQMRADGDTVDFHMYRSRLRGSGMVGSSPDVVQARSFMLRQVDEAIAQRRAPQPRSRRLDVPLV